MRARPDLPARRVAWASASAAAVVLALVVVVTGGTIGLQVRLALVLAATVATATGVVRNRPSRRRPWLLLLAGMAASAAGDVLVLVASRQGSLTANLPSDAWLTAAAGVLFLAGLLDALRPVGRGDLGSVLDATIATVATGSLVWQLVVVPAAAPGWTGSGTELAGALQVSVLLAVLALLVRATLNTPRGRRVAAVLLAAGVLFAVVAFLLGALRDAAGGDAYSGARAGLGALANLCAGVSALHPSMRSLTERHAVAPDRVSLGRTLLLGAALAAPPAVLLTAAATGNDVASVSLTASWVLLAVAVLARVHLLQRGGELARRQLDRSEQRLVSLVANTADTVLLVATPPGGTPQVRFASPACRRLLGRDPDAVAATPLGELVDPQDARVFLAAVTGDDPLPVSVDVRARHRDGELRWVEAVVDAAPQEQDRSVVVTLRDVHERKHTELRLAEAALRDELTGLWNRRGFDALLGAALAAPRPPGKQVALLLGDLDGFKLVNDLAGHAAGDAVLRTLARRVESVVREGDVVGRIGGDEFVVLCPSIDDHATVAAIAARIVQVGHQPFRSEDGAEHLVGVSIGVALADTEVAPEDLLRRADAALYAAKEGGKGQVRFASAAGS